MVERWPIWFNTGGDVRYTEIDFDRSGRAKLLNVKGHRVERYVLGYFLLGHVVPGDLTRVRCELYGPSFRQCDIVNAFKNRKAFFKLSMGKSKPVKYVKRHDVVKSVRFKIELDLQITAFLWDVVDTTKLATFHFL